jgi:hypothetical protein
MRIRLFQQLPKPQPERHVEVNKEDTQANDKTHRLRREENDKPEWRAEKNTSRGHTVTASL